MRTLEEFLLLGSETLTLWRRYFLRLGAWFCLGFGLHHLGIQLSPGLGVEHQFAATMVFVLGVLAWLGGLILMIHSLEPGLRTPAQIDEANLPPDLSIPGQVFRTERRLDVLTSAVGPFLAVYAVWGFVEDEVRDLFFANISQEGTGAVLSWSISFDPDRLPFYLGLGAAAWVLGKAVDALAARHPRPWLTLPAVILDGTAVFALFMALGILAGLIKDWWDARVLAVGLHNAARWLVDQLPDWQLWFGLTLPDAIRAAASWVWGTLLPGALDGILLPLMWLALTATVFGWREFRGRDIVAGTRLQQRADRWGQASEQRKAGALPLLTSLATDDLRTKYLPVGNALRLIWRAGPRFLGVYLVLSALLRMAESWFSVAVTAIIGPHSLAVTFVISGFLDLVQGLLFTTLSVALYAAAFDRCIADVTGTTWRSRPKRKATPAKN